MTKDPTPVGSLVLRENDPRLPFFLMQVIGHTEEGRCRTRYVHPRFLHRFGLEDFERTWVIGASGLRTPEEVGIHTFPVAGGRNMPDRFPPVEVVCRPSHDQPASLRIIALPQGSPVPLGTPVQDSLNLQGQLADDQGLLRFWINRYGGACVFERSGDGREWRLLDGEDWLDAYEAIVNEYPRLAAAKAAGQAPRGLTYGAPHDAPGWLRDRFKAVAKSSDETLDRVLEAAMLCGPDNPFSDHDVGMEVLRAKQDQGQDTPEHSEPEGPTP